MSVQISRILHAGYLLEHEGVRIAFDPIFENPFSRNCYAFPHVTFDEERIREEQFSAVFISHYHDDHCSLESLNLLDRATPIYMFCVHFELFDLIRELGFFQVHSLELESPVEIGPFRVTAKRALDAAVDSLFHIQVSGLNILNVVDSWIDHEMIEELEKMTWDLVLWPFQTMRELEVIAPTRFEKSDRKLPREWVEQLTRLSPRCLVPSSCQFLLEDWSWYNKAFFPISYKNFTDQVSTFLPKTELIRLDPSRSIFLDKDIVKEAPSLPWLRLLDEAEVDYDYQPDLTPPSTEEVARHFPALTEEQRIRLEDFCCRGLPEKYAEMGPSADPFFRKDRVWQLSLFDHHGRAKVFRYHLRDDVMTLLGDSQVLTEWATEVPMYKLYGALESGEALTSMYVRINDCKFEPSLEKAVAEADILADPLIRCLFIDSFASYQRAQIKRIKGALRPGAAFS